MYDMTRKNVFQRANLVREVVCGVIGKELNDNEIVPYLSKAESYYKGNIKNVSPEIIEIYKKLSIRGLKPNSAYKCLRASLMPSDIKEKVYGMKLSVSRALRICSDSEERRRVELERRIFELGMKAIRGLRQNDTKST